MGKKKGGNCLQGFRVAGMSATFVGTHIFEFRHFFYIGHRCNQADIPKFEEMCMCKWKGK